MTDKSTALKDALKKNRSVQVNPKENEIEKISVQKSNSDVLDNLNTIAIQLRNEEIQTLNNVCNEIKINRPKSLKKDRITKSTVIRCLIAVLEDKMNNIDFSNIDDEDSLKERLMGLLI